MQAIEKKSIKSQPAGAEPVKFKGKFIQVIGRRKTATARARLYLPNEEVTIAGNLAQMFKGIVAIGKDIERRGSKQVGSILIDHMTVAGN